MLSRYRVLDFTRERNLICGQILSDLGAEVIHVEFPETSINIKSELPKKLNYILNEKENFDVINNDILEVKKYMLNKLN